MFQLHEIRHDGAIQPDFAELNRFNEHRSKRFNPISLCKSNIISIRSWIQALLDWMGNIYNPLLDWINLNYYVNVCNSRNRWLLVNLVIALNKGLIYKRLLNSFTPIWREETHLCIALIRTLWVKLGGQFSNQRDDNTVDNTHRVLVILLVSLFSN